MQVKIGDAACLIVNVSNIEVSCTVPVASGVDLNITLSVGGQQAVATKKFNYPPPVVYKVQPSSVPSFGGQDITLTGFGFGKQDAGTTAVLKLPSGAALNCTPSNWTNTLIVCNVPKSGSPDEQKAAVIVTS